MHANADGGQSTTPWSRTRLGRTARKHPARRLCLFCHAHASQSQHNQRFHGVDALVCAVCCFFSFCARARQPDAAAQTSLAAELGLDRWANDPRVLRWVRVPPGSKVSIPSNRTPPPLNATRMRRKFSVARNCNRTRGPQARGNDLAAAMKIAPADHHFCALYARTMAPSSTPPRAGRSTCTRARWAPAARCTRSPAGSANEGRRRRGEP